MLQAIKDEVTACRLHLTSNAQHISHIRAIAAERFSEIYRGDKGEYLGEMPVIDA